MSRRVREHDGRDTDGRKKGNKETEREARREEQRESDGKEHR